MMNCHRKCYLLSRSSIPLNRAPFYFRSRQFFALKLSKLHSIPYIRNQHSIIHFTEFLDFSTFFYLSPYLNRCLYRYLYLHLYHSLCVCAYLRTKYAGIACNTRVHDIQSQRRWQSRRCFRIRNIFA